MELKTEKWSYAFLRLCKLRWRKQRVRNQSLESVQSLTCFPSEMPAPCSIKRYLANPQTFHKAIASIFIWLISAASQEAILSPNDVSLSTYSHRFDLPLQLSCRGDKTDNRHNYFPADIPNNQKNFRCEHSGPKRSTWIR